MKLIYLSFIFSLFISFPLYATEVKDTKNNLTYMADPIYKPLYDGAPHPLTDMLNLAEDGDVRAQYILADLYLKGKGGFAPNTEKSIYWFEKSAKQDYPHSFVRLAAIAKAQNDIIKAYQWYYLGAKRSKKTNYKLSVYMKNKQSELIETNNLSKKDISTAKKQAKQWKRSTSKNNVSKSSTPEYNQ